MIRVALTKGRLGHDAMSVFKKLNLKKPIDLDSRQLVFSDESFEFILLKPIDVITYVDQGICDLGVLGSDVIMEDHREVYELKDLKFGRCKLVIAGLKGGPDIMSKEPLRVATKYPRIAKSYFMQVGKDIEVVPLKGSVELAPVVGLADCIVDIVESGATLRANNLEVIEDMYDVSARLICNDGSYRFNQKEFVRLLGLIGGKS